jgi:hypothetical protein
MVDEDTIRQFFRRLNHKPLGFTELVAIHKNGGITGTGLFDDECRFVHACGTFSGECNLYAGRNPRRPVSSAKNRMDTILRLRASDSHIQFLTAFSLDIDPVRKKGIPATAGQREAALRFASLLQRFLGGYVDDSGNGAYLWLPFFSPIHISPSNAVEIKTKCRQWQKQITKSFCPSEYGLRVDGCFDFSRLKRVIGTFNHKAQRFSSIHLEGKPSDKVRDEILSTSIRHPEKKLTAPSASLHRIPQELPRRFTQLLDEDSSLLAHWTTADPFGDRSAHDWMLGRSCVERGIVDPKELAMVLMKNPNGKYRRDGKIDYIQTTVSNLKSAP